MFSHASLVIILGTPQRVKSSKSRKYSLNCPCHEVTIILFTSVVSCAHCETAIRDVGLDRSEHTARAVQPTQSLLLPLLADEHFLSDFNVRLSHFTSQSPTSAAGAIALRRFRTGLCCDSSCLLYLSLFRHSRLLSVYPVIPSPPWANCFC